MKSWLRFLAWFLTTAMVTPLAMAQPSPLGATPDRDCPAEQAALGGTYPADVRAKAGGSWDRYFDVNIHFYTRPQLGTPRTQDVAWLRQFVADLKPRIHAEMNVDRPAMYWLVCKAEARISRMTGKTKPSPANVANRAQEACQGSFDNAWNIYLRSSPYGKPNQSESFAYWRNLSGANEGCGGNPLILRKYQGVGDNNDDVGRANAAFGVIVVCVQRFLASPQCSAGGATTTARVDPPRSSSGQQPSYPGTAPKPAPNPTPSVSSARPAASGSSGTLGTTSVASNSAQAQARQAALDEQRRGKPKRNYSDRMAHQCISLIKDHTISGGFINTCTYPIRFTWCNHRPKKGAWSDSFDCAKMGSFGNTFLPAGGRTAEHTLGTEKVLWFACRVDNPYDDIVEVGDAEFDPKGPFIRARCVKWGDRP